MKRLYSSILIPIILLLSAVAAEPKAKLSGPTTAAVGEKVIYDVSGSSSDPETPLQVQISGPSAPPVQIWYDSDRQPGMIVFSPTVNGRYYIFVAATGKKSTSSAPYMVFAPGVLDVGTSPGPPGPSPGPPTPPLPIGDYDPAFVPIGRAIASQFAVDYASAVEDGAKLLTVGQTRTAAYSTISKAFSANRQESFDRLAGPALEKISPGNVPDGQLTQAQNQALAKAIRGLAKGAISHD